VPETFGLPNLDQIGFLLGRAYYSYIGLLQRWLDEAGLSVHLKPGMGSLLFALFRQDDRSMTAVAEDLQIAKSTMTGMVKRMQKAGLLTVDADQEDGRSVRLKLTPLARSLEARCLQLSDAMERLLLKNVPKPDREPFRRTLILLTQTIAAALDLPASATIPGEQRQGKRVAFKRKRRGVNT